VKAREYERVIVRVGDEGNGNLPVRLYAQGWVELVVFAEAGVVDPLSNIVRNSGWCVCCLEV
jgi:hypothetical protein